MKGPLKTALNTTDMSDIMDFDMFPFGQATWNTPTCGVGDTSSYVWGSFWEGYDANARICYDVACGADAEQFFGHRKAECFDKSTGPFCQHGGAECAVNAIQACSKKLSSNKWTEYGLFAVCFEEHYEAIQIPAGATKDDNYAKNRSLAEVAINATMKKCAEGTPFKVDELLSCFYNSENEMLIEMAKATVPHVTIPFVRIMQCNGSWNVLELGDGNPPNDLLVNAVCASACSGSTAAQKCKTAAPRHKRQSEMVLT